MKKSRPTKLKSASSESASALIDARIQELGDWTRRNAFPPPLSDQTEPTLEVVEEYKWKKPSNPHGTPVWSHYGIICTGETYKQVVKLTFAKGAVFG